MSGIIQEETSSPNLLQSRCLPDRFEVAVRFLRHGVSCWTLRDHFGRLIYLKDGHIDLSDRLLFDNEDNHYSILFILKFESRQGPRYVFSTAKGYIGPNNVCIVPINDSTISLLEAGSQTYLSSMPIEYAPHFRLQAVSPKTAAWESFSLVRAFDIPTPVLERIGRLVELLDDPEPSAAFGRAIEAADLETIDVIESLHHHLTVDALRAFQTTLDFHRSSAGLTALRDRIESLALLFPPNPHNVDRRIVDQSFDHLAKRGWGRHFPSFWSAMSALWRERIHPRPGRVCIVAVARNEGRYLIEWVAYHLALGVDRIFLYTNDNDDGSDALLRCLDENGFITWVRNIKPSILRAHESIQSKAYAYALTHDERILDYEWCALIDLDEFIAIDPDRFCGIIDFLAQECFAEADAIGLNWQNVWPSAQDGPFRQGLTMRAQGVALGPDWHIKSIVRPCRFTHASPHAAFFDARFQRRYVNEAGDDHRSADLSDTSDDRGAIAFSRRAVADIACIYHYYFKSPEEWLWKCSRSRGGESEVSLAVKTISVSQMEAFEQFVHANPGTRNWVIERTGASDVADRIRASAGVEQALSTIESHWAERLDMLRAACLSTYRDMPNEACQSFLARISTEGDTASGEGSADAL